MFGEFQGKLACIFDKIWVALEFAFRLPSPRLAKCLQDLPDRSTWTRRNVVVGRREPALNIYDGETPVLPILPLKLPSRSASFEAVPVFST